MFGSYFRVFGSDGRAILWFGSDEREILWFGSDGRAILCGKVKAIFEVLTSQFPHRIFQSGLIYTHHTRQKMFIFPRSLLTDTSK
jgi:hypothetical protein